MSDTVKTFCSLEWPVANSDERFTVTYFIDRDVKQNAWVIKSITNDAEAKLEPLNPYQDACWDGCDGALSMAMAYIAWQRDALVASGWVELS
jgi:hypothetical protein